MATESTEINRRFRLAPCHLIPTVQASVVCYQILYLVLPETIESIGYILPLTIHRTLFEFWSNFALCLRVLQSHVIILACTRLLALHVRLYL